MTAPASASQLDSGSPHSDDAYVSDAGFANFRRTAGHTHFYTPDRPASPATPDGAASRIATLTVRQRQILHRVLAGDPSKNIAADLGISQRTVDNHRAAIMKKTASRSIAALVRTALAAGFL